ncbi:DivIVA domain-containing protein [Rubrobacter indicoceani]|uniref:DivIVA domain-containing protein n=1 Tax=Rubrobacter indicoceani TaxID=2051957 RepID=UPI000E5BB25E|nr:DivIVA domain-containing protein [Rubrobacter indicoceani]
MAIRPIDVRRKEFKNGFRGYDANQVDDFLDQVADEFERAYTDNQRMREEVSSLRERLQQFEDLEGSIRSALVHAEQASNDLRNSAQREADETRLSSQRDAESLRISSQKEAELTIQEAQNRAHQMLADSSGRVERIQESYEALVDAKRDFKNDFRQLLKTYMDVMEDMEVSSAKGIEAQLRNRLDTESMAVAREAAASDGPGEGGTSPGIAASGLQRQPVNGEEGIQGGPLYETDEAPVAAADNDASASSSDETQRIDLSEMPGSQTREPGAAGKNPDRAGEVGSSDSENYGGEDTVVSGGAGTGASSPEDARDEREYESTEDPAADEFFDREDQETSDEEPQEDSRIFRASRFLRRRG